ncbi:LOW QUALITY PROTEIN: exodeoxyribonuclease VII large subunit [Geomicrobium sp. JCM 19039]|nr:LOW QUALITY PROTEIN: exodeoxyribonuclease VII large subunit [Geomicrobium sp. JCM 19039]
MEANHSYLSVTQVTKELKRIIEQHEQMNHVMLYGEISNFKHHSRGHMYFTLKDDRARISAVMFAGNNRALRFHPENGMKVLIQGNISVYEPYGQYQLYVRNMEPDGLGQLYLAYEQLKKKLETEGLFANERKKPLPSFPKRVGVVTSQTGAVIRDIYTTITRRYPQAAIHLYPVAVQGPEAVPSIVNALKRADVAGLDVLIAGRGGGSIEELWAFNDEQVVRTTAMLTTPIISAVGHETDVTLHDFVADVRAATPTAAAELAVPSMKEWTDKLISIQKRLTVASKQLLRQRQVKLKQLRQSYAFKYPEQLVTQKEQELDRNLEYLHRFMKRYMGDKKQSYVDVSHRLERMNRCDAQRKTFRLQQLKERLQRSMKEVFQKQSTAFDTRLSKLEILNPLNTLRRGYNVAYQGEQLVSSIKHIQSSLPLTLHLHDGQVTSEVQTVSEKQSLALKGEPIDDE